MINIREEFDNCDDNLVYIQNSYNSNEGKNYLEIGNHLNEKLIQITSTQKETEDAHCNLISNETNNLENVYENIINIVKKEGNEYDSKKSQKNIIYKKEKKTIIKKEGIRKDNITTKIKSLLQLDVHKSLKPYLKKGKKLKKIDHKRFIKQNSGFINRIIFLKTIKEYLCFNEKNKKIIEELEIEAKNNMDLYFLLNMTYLRFIYEIFINKNNKYGIDNSKYEIQKQLVQDKIGFIKYYEEKKGRRLKEDPERDRILGIQPKK